MICSASNIENEITAKKHFYTLTLSFSLFLNSIFSQCNTGWTKITAGVYASITLGSNSYIAAGDVVNVTGAFSVSSKNFCNEGTLNAGSFSDLSQTGSNTNLVGGTINITNDMTQAGDLTNSGDINVGGTFSKASNSGAITNNAGSRIIVTGNITAEGPITNSGKIASTGGTFSKTGTTAPVINNTGAWIVSSGNMEMEGDITNTHGGIQSTNGTFTHTTSSGVTFANVSGGLLQASGDISMEGIINNCGTIEITNSGKFTKTGSTGSTTNSVGSSIIIRGSGLNTRWEGGFTNDGNVKIEGAFSQTATAAGNMLTNSSTGYFRVCNDFTNQGNISNSGTIDALANLDLSTSTGVQLINNSGGTLNVTNDFKTAGSVFNYGCITVGGQFWKTLSGTTDITISGGTIFTVDFLQENGNLIGGGLAADRGYLRVSGTSTTTNTVPLSGYLDLCDASGAGAGAQYLDTESPSYTPYPVTNITDCGSSPGCTQATFANANDPLPAASGSCSEILLPITLLSFSGECDNTIVVLSWTTASETNNDHFVIERCVYPINDLIVWEEIGLIPGAENSSAKLDYKFVDEKLPQKEIENNIIYYRFKQVDRDGQYAYSPIITVSCETTNNFSFDIYPNPSTTSDFNIVFKGAMNDEVTILIYDALGKICYSKTLYSPTNGAEYTLNTAAKLAQGIYTVVARSAQQLHFKKLIIE